MSDDDDDERRRRNAELQSSAIGRGLRVLGNWLASCWRWVWGR